MDTKRIEATALDTENEDESLPVYSHEGDSRLPPSDSNLEVTEKQGLGLNEDPLAFEAIPSVEACLTHLKLLRAFEGLKQKVGYTDGLWDIWDSRAQGKLDILVKLREKRWALYVARAVNRYEVWWQSFVPRMLLEKDMIKQPGGTESSTYEGFVSQSEHIRWTTDILPPPGKLF